MCLASFRSFFLFDGFFADAVQDDAELKRIEAAWAKAVLLHATLWSRPYTVEGLW